MSDVTLAAKAEAVVAIRALVEKLRRIDATGTARRYNEARTVNEFVLPLFEALGWDIHNRTAGNEVLPEQSAAAGRADWTFSIHGIAKVLVEAKSLSANLSNPTFARQAINYSYGRGVTWAILTNFRELHVYNAEWALPDPELSRFLSFKWEDLEADVDRLWLLSRPAFEEGRLNEEAERYGRKRRKTPVGEQLFRDLLEFRFNLRKSFRAYNPSVPLGTTRVAAAQLGRRHHEQFVSRATKPVDANGGPALSGRPPTRLRWSTPLAGARRPTRRREGGGGPHRPQPAPGVAG